MKKYNIIKINIIILALIGLAFTIEAAPTGSISGHVTDGATGSPLPDAAVQLFGTPYGATTDATGNFRILAIPPGTYALTISYIGYETSVRTDLAVKSGAMLTVNEALNPSALQGAEVEVRTGLFNREVRSPVSTLSLTREEIRRNPGGFEDVVRVVSALPGIAVVNEGGRNDLLVRGGGPTENLYVVNNIEVPNINHFGTQGSASGSLSFINLDFIERVDFSAGGFGARYGDKMSSVLDINLRDGRSDRFGGRGTISATQFALDAEGPLGTNGSVILSARKSYLDLIFKAAGQPFIPVYTDYNLFSSYELSPTERLNFVGLVAIDRIERDQSDAEARTTNAGIMENSQDQGVFGGNYRKLFRNGFMDITGNFNTNRFHFSQINENEEVYFRSDARESEAGLKLATTLVRQSGVRWTFGAGGKQMFIDNETNFADTIYNRSGVRVPLAVTGLPANLQMEQSLGKYNIWGEVRKPIGVSTDVTLGTRLDYYEYLETPLYIAPRLALDRRLSQRLQAKVAVGRYYQSPASVWILNPANSSLSALRNDMGVAGLSYLLREDMRLNIEAYTKRYRNLPAGATPATSHIVLSNEGVGYGGREDDFTSFGYSGLQSSGYGRAYGVELQAQKKLSEIKCYGQAALSLGRSLYTAPNGVTYPGLFDQRVVFSVTGGYVPNPRWEYSGRFRFWSGAPYTPVYRPAENGGEISNIPDEYLAKRLDPGHHLDLRVDRRFNLTGWSMIVFVDVQNVYNYKIHLRPRYDLWLDKVEDRNSIGILPSIGMRVEF